MNYERKKQVLERIEGTNPTVAALRTADKFLDNLPYGSRAPDVIDNNGIQHQIRLKWDFASAHRANDHLTVIIENAYVRFSRQEWDEIIEVQSPDPRTTRYLFGRIDKSVEIEVPPAPTPTADQAAAEPDDSPF